jgi:hypothetical protein
VPILLLASVMHVVRRNVFDFLLFFGTAVLIVVDSRRITGRASEPEVPAAVRHRWLAAAAVALFAAIIALLPIAGGMVRIVVSACGLAALALVLVRPAAAPTPVAAGDAPGRLRGWWVWATVGVVTCLWELSSFIAQQVWPADQVNHPAASDLIGPLLTTWLGRAILLLLWGAAGYWLLHQLVTSGGRGAGTSAGMSGPPQAPPTEPSRTDGSRHSQPSGPSSPRWEAGR